jgi:O-Antigen ligase
VASIAGIVTRLIIALTVFALALDDGTFGIVNRSSLAIAVWWAIGLGVALGLLPLGRLGGPALITMGLFAAFVAWTGASIAWSVSAEKAFNEFNRTALYLGVLVLAAFVANKANAERWSDGAAIGITAVGVLALTTRLFPESFAADPADRYFSGPQLRYPLHYSNGLAIFVGLAVPLLLRAAVFAERALWRALAVAAFPPLAAVLYLTSSRGGVGVALVGAIAFVLPTARRWAATAAATSAALSSAAAIAIVARQHDLVDRPDAAAAVSQGKTATVGILVVCAATAAIYHLGERLLRQRRTPASSIGWATAGAVVVLALAGIAAANPTERFDAFRKPPEENSEPYRVRGHLLSVTSSGRWQFWRAAVEQFEDAPVLGDGAGSYEAWWARHGSIAMFIVDAHSLYLETAAELGFVGLSLLLAALLAALAASLLALRRLDDKHRGTAAALIACALGYGLGAGIDWMWELTVVSLIAVACVGLLAQSPEWVDEAPVERRVLPPIARAAIAVLAVGVIVSQASSLLGAVSIRESEAAVEAGDDGAAVDAAQDAHSLQPWAASPYLQLALVHEDRGRIGPALLAIGEAVERDRDDWRLWLVQARIQTRAGRIARARQSLARAASLNPRSPLFADFR